MIDPLQPIGGGHTELSEEDRRGLLPSYIATRSELSDAEQRNITQALLRRPPTLEQFLDDKYLRDLHRAMFRDVWGWAGKYRKRETNIGIDPARISTEVRTLIDNAAAWIRHGADEPDEIGVRFHHRLVVIHAFPNGNGRHGRISADYLMNALDHKPFTWGAGLAVSTHELRTIYVTALQHADRDDIERLLDFARA